MFVGKTDAPPQMNYWQAARKAIIMNISDLAAKGVKPLGLLVSLGIPRDLTKKDIEQIGKGLNMGAREYDTYILGGDTSETQDLIISVSAFGLERKETLILRSGAGPKNIVATTGLFGLTSAGLKILTKNLTAPTRIRRKLVEAILMPRARLKEGLALAETGAVTASIDSSDGFVWSLYEIGSASNVGFIIDAPPIAPETYDFARLHNLDPFKLSLYGGEEYELIVTIKSERWRKTREAVVKKGGNLMKIGRTTAKKTLLLKYGNKTFEMKVKGYEHFRHGESN